MTFSRLKLRVLAARTRPALLSQLQELIQLNLAERACSSMLTLMIGIDKARSAVAAVYGLQIPQVYM